jgi:3-deoxy-manno-octulosonate cytidylyltransferase (CMP-KDO synthetase)
VKALGVIPARLGSTRLSEKVLRPIHGKPMIQHVWERARQAKHLAEVIVACDDTRIQEAVQAFGGKAVMTRVDHPNGSSRIAEAAAKENFEVLINIQGDEPAIRPEGIDRLAELLLAHPEIPVATLAVRKTNRAEFENPNVVKVVVDAEGNALYFSRSPLPYFRDEKTSFSFLKHQGIYGYRKNFLLQFVTWGMSKLEETEKLEQLRILERGAKIRVIETPFDSQGVDTAEDLEKIEIVIASGAKQSK